MSKKVLIYGDVMLDAYIYGSVSRISPEAPVPVLRVTSEAEKIGGAGNVANNLTALGAQAAGMFLYGNDLDAQRLKTLLAENGVLCNWMVKDDQVKTIKKTRTICKNQQIVRLDYNDHFDISDNIREKINEMLPAAIEWADTVIISDYDKGSCEPEICQAIIQECRNQSKPVIVDPKGRAWDKYRGATVITPNMSEINVYSGLSIANEDDAIEAHYSQIHRQLGIQYVLLTRSEKGMSLIGDNTMLHIAAEKREVYDVSGAGDTVVATLALMLDKDLSNIKRAVNTANIAAGIVVSKPGTAVATRQELDDALNKRHFNSESKIYDMGSRTELLNRVKHWKEHGETIAFTNGCFDIIHKGHVALLNEAKTYADHLIVGLNTDASVKRLKGESRPINNEMDRAYVISNFKCVDAVVLFDPLIDNQEIPAAEMAAFSTDMQQRAAEAPMGIARQITPDVHVKGGDYCKDTVPEAIYAKEFVAVPFVTGYSTTNTISKTRAADGERNA